MTYDKKDQLSIVSISSWTALCSGSSAGFSVSWHGIGTLTTAVAFTEEEKKESFSSTPAIRPNAHRVGNFQFAVFFIPATVLLPKKQFTQTTELEQLPTLIT